MISYRNADLIDTFKRKNITGTIRIARTTDPWGEQFWTVRKPNDNTPDDLYRISLQTLGECGFSEGDADIHGFFMPAAEIRHIDAVYNKILDVMPKHGLLPLEASLTPKEDPYLITIKYKWINL